MRGLGILNSLETPVSLIGEVLLREIVLFSSLQDIENRETPFRYPYRMQVSFIPLTERALGMAGDISKIISFLLGEDPFLQQKLPQLLKKPDTYKRQNGSEKNQLEMPL